MPINAVIVKTTEIPASPSALLEALHGTIEEDGDLSLVGTDGVVVKCHRQVLLAISAYFESFLNFNANSD